MSEEKSGLQSFARGVSWMSTTAVLSRLLATVGGVLLLRILNKGDYGLMQMATITIQTVGLVRDLGMGPALVAMKKDIQKAANTAFYTYLGTALITLFILWTFAGPISNGLFKEPQLVPILQMAALSVLFSSLAAVPLNLMLKSERWRAYAIIDSLHAPVSSFTMVILAYQGLGVWSIVYGNLAGVILQCVLAWILGRWRPQLQFDWGMLKNLFKFGKWVTVDRVCDYTFTSADNYYLAIARGKESLGLYGVAYRWVEIPIQFIVMRANRAMFSVLSAMESEEARKRLMLKSNKIMTFLLNPIYMFLMFNAALFTEVVAGEKWLESAPILQWLCALAMLRVTTAVTIGPFYWANNAPQLAVYPQFAGLLLIGIAYASGWQLTALQVAQLFTMAYVVRSLVIVLWLPFKYGFKWSEVFGLLFSAAIPGAIAGWLSMLSASALPVAPAFKLLSALFVWGNLYLIFYSLIQFRKPFTLHTPSAWKKMMRDFKSGGGKRKEEAAEENTTEGGIV